MKDYNFLIEQLYKMEYTPLRFTIYNFIENDGYVAEISGCKGQHYDIDDFEFFAFDIPDDDKFALRSDDAATVVKYSNFAHTVKTAQETPECAVFIMKDFGLVIAVKLREFDINDLHF